MSGTSPFYKASKARGIVPCPHWTYFKLDEIKSATLRLLGPPVRSPSIRYAIHCFDREDGKLKALEGPHELFEQFAFFERATGINPSGPDSPDFRITLVTQPFRYFVAPLTLTPLTEREKLDVAFGAFDLGKIYQTGESLHVVHVASRLGLWPKPVWPSKLQEQCNASSPDQLAAKGIVIRFPHRNDM